MDGRLRRGGGVRAARLRGQRLDANESGTCLDQMLTKARLKLNGTPPASVTLGHVNVRRNSRGTQVLPSPAWLSRWPGSKWLLVYACARDRSWREWLCHHMHVDDLKPKADDQSHQPAKHIEETARLASSVETAKDPGKVRRTKG